MKKTVRKRIIAGILTTVTALSVGTAVTASVEAATVDEAPVGSSVSDYWADLGRSGMENAIKNMFGEVPVVGEIFAGPLSSLMADQLGFGELSTNDLSKQISDLSYHLDIRFNELDKKLSDIDKDVKHVEAKLDENTEIMILNMRKATATNFHHLTANQKVGNSSLLRRAIENGCPFGHPFFVYHRACVKRGGSWSRSRRSRSRSRCFCCCR